MHAHDEILEKTVSHQPLDECTLISREVKPVVIQTAMAVAGRDYCIKLHIHMLTQRQQYMVRCSII